MFSLIPVVNLLLDQRISPTDLLIQRLFRGDCCEPLPGAYFSSNRRRPRRRPVARRHVTLIAARAMAPDSSRNFGEQDFVTSH